MIADQVKSKLNHFNVAFVACLPFAGLQLLYLSDTNGFDYVLFGYSLIGTVGCMVAFTWVVYLIAEVSWRKNQSVRIGVPYFSFAGGVLLVLFFVPGLLLRPVLETIPSFCRVTQVTRWSTSKGEFILVASGTGTVNQHRLHGGYMNWTGDGSAGFSSFYVQPIEFQYNYYEPYFQGSMVLLRNRMAKSGIENSELNLVSSDIWSVLQQAAEGTEIKTAIGDMGNVESAVADGWDARIGGVIWLIVLLVVFLTVSRLTIFEEMQSCVASR